MKGTLLTKLLALIIILGLLAAGPRPAQALPFNLTPSQATQLAFASLWTTVAITSLYIMWLNRPSQQNKVSWDLKGPGGWFIGGFMGVSLVQGNDFRYIEKDGVNPFTPPTVTASTLNYNPGVVGGVKLGRFSHTVPYLGWELEGMLTRNDNPRQRVTLSRPVEGQTVGVIPYDTRINITLAFHFLARYGFLKDKEVTFGRLQPYVGLGPGLVLIYGSVDAAKNFSLEALAGVRYMILKHLSVFTEYKISQQWDVELAHSKLLLIKDFNPERRGNAHFDWTSHKIVVGVAFHFL